MSNVSAHAEHLVRAAVKGIKASPESWDQGWFVSTPQDYEDLGIEVPSCGTTYCVGGWMMLYDGWKHVRESKFVNAWTKGDRRITNPFTDHLSSLIEPYAGRQYISETIFDVGIVSIGDLMEKIDNDLEINFDEDCPCLTEEGNCILAGCPCGKHVFTHRLPEVTLLEGEDNPLMNVITNFVDKAKDAGDRITVRQVLADKIMMDAFIEAFQAGMSSVVETVTKKAERRILEARMGRDINDSAYNALLEEHGHLRREARENGTAVDELRQVIRTLQGQVDDLKSGRRGSAEVRKLKAKLAREEAETARLQALVSECWPAYTVVQALRVLMEGNPRGGTTT